MPVKYWSYLPAIIAFITNIKEIKMQTQTNNYKSNVKLIPTNNPKRFIVQLDLPSERRYIGYINTAGDGAFITEKQKKHIYRKYNSFGVSYDLLHNPNIEFKWIIIKYQGNEYTSTREYYLQKGKITNFTNKGYELQLHVPLEELNIETVNKFEATRPNQLNLFNSDEADDYARA